MKFNPQFDRLLQTLNTISVGFRLDVITKIEIKLNEYKNQIKSEANDYNSDTNCEQNSGLSPKLDILYDAIASNIKDFNTTTDADNKFIQTQVNIAMNPSPHLTPLIIQNASHIYELTADPSQQTTKCMSNLAVNSGTGLHICVSSELYTNQLK